MSGFLSKRTTISLSVFSERNPANGHRSRLNFEDEALASRPFSAPEGEHWFLEAYLLWCWL